MCVGEVFVMLGWRGGGGGAGVVSGGKFGGGSMEFCPYAGEKSPPALKSTPCKSCCKSTDKISSSSSAVFSWSTSDSKTFRISASTKIPGVTIGQSLPKKPPLPSSMSKSKSPHVPIPVHCFTPKNPSEDSASNLAACTALASLYSFSIITVM